MADQKNYFIVYNTSSTLRKQLNHNEKYKTATWIRKSKQQTKQLKKQLICEKNQAFYDCTFFDLDCYIQLIVENWKGQKFVSQYGPIMLEQKAKKLIYSDCSQYLWGAVHIQLAKNMKQQGKISFSQNKRKFNINISLQKINITLQYNKYNCWRNYQTILKCKDGEREVLHLQLFQNKYKFMKDMEQLKINNLYGSHIVVKFESKAHLDTFLTYFFLFVNSNHETQQINKSTTNQSKAESKIMFASNDFNAVFTPTEHMENQNGTPPIPDWILHDFKQILETPKSELAHQNFKQCGFSNFDKFISSNKMDEAAAQTTQTIREEQNEEQQATQRFKTKVFKQTGSLPTNIRSQTYFKLTESFKSSPIKYIEHKVENQQQNYKYTYEQLLTLNKYLEQRNKKLTEENYQLRLKQQKYFTVQKRDKMRYTFNHIPQFLKNKQSIKKSKTLFQIAHKAQKNQNNMMKQLSSRVTSLQNIQDKRKLKQTKTHRDLRKQLKLIKTPQHKIYNNKANSTLKKQIDSFKLQ